MTSLEALILGIIQGITEFLPVSSSGHLLIAEHFLKIQADPLSMQVFNILLHAGSLIALLWCYRARWVRLMLAGIGRNPADRNLLVLLIIATIPAAIVGVLLEDIIATTWSSLFWVGMSFIGNALILFLGERREGGNGKEHLTMGQSLFIGLAQACALVPGLSRSALTISTAQAAGLRREEAIDFSFLMATPILAGAVLIGGIDIVRGMATLPPPPTAGIGVLSSLVASIIAIRFLQKFSLTRRLTWFCPYLLAVAISLAFLAR